MIFPKSCNIKIISSRNAEIKSSQTWPFQIRRFQKTKSGMILIDILVAIALATVFFLVISQSNQQSRDLFEFSKERDRLLNIYETQASAGYFEGMLPGESRILTIDSSDPDYSSFSTTTLSAEARWYGNDRIETDMLVSSPQNFIHLTKIDTFPFSDFTESAGTSLCSVDFTNRDIVGSYGYFNRSNPNPQSLNTQIVPIILPIDPTLLMTDIIVRNGIAYIGTDSVRQADPDIVIIDIHNRSNASLISGIHTGPGISSIALAGNRLFVAVTSRTAQLQIIRMSDLSNLAIESSYKLPLPESSTTPSLGSAIFYDRELIYLGTEKWDGEEFSIIDVSDPTNPNKIGGLETDSKINSIYVRNGLAYVAASDEKQLQVIDVRDPTRPYLIDLFSPSGWERQIGKSFSYFEDRLDFGRTSGGFNIKKDHELFSWGSSTLPYLNSNAEFSADIPGGVYGIVSDRSYTYAISQRSNNEFMIFNHDLLSTTSKSIALPVLPQSLTCDNDSIYVLAVTAPIIYQISFK